MRRIEFEDYDGIADQDVDDVADPEATTDSSVDRKIRRLALNCSYCRPHRGENARRQARRSWKHRSKARKSWAT